jgi:hypothetical protein
MIVADKWITTANPDAQHIEIGMISLLKNFIFNGTALGSPTRQAARSRITSFVSV